MDETTEPRPLRYGLMSMVVVSILGTGLGYKLLKNHKDKDETANYAISYPPPSNGWQTMQHGAQVLFIYGDEKRGLQLRGSVNQMVSGVNPTPDLDRDNLAKLIVDNTHDNQKGWTAEVQDVVDAKGTSFRIVRRSERKHVVITGFAVKGNTTLLVSLSARDSNFTEVDKAGNEFREFLSMVEFTKADSSKW